VLYPGMVFEPLSDHDALVSLQIVGDHVDDSLRDGPLYLLKQLYVALGVPRAGREGQRLSVIYSEGAENPRLVRAAAVLQRRLDAVPVRRLSRGRGEEPRGYGAELVDADHRGARWRVRVESDDRGPFGAKLRVRALGPRPGVAPAHAFSEQDAPYLAAPYLDAHLLCGLGERVQSPVGGPLLVFGLEAAAGLGDELARRVFGDQGDDLDVDVSGIPEETGS
jgi:hypothetical protein